VSQTCYIEEEEAEEAEASYQWFIIIVKPSSPSWELAFKTFKHLARHRIFIVQILGQPPDHVHLFLNGQACNGSFDNTSHACFVHGNEALVVHVGKETHDELAVHSVSDASMARNAVSKILDLERPLKAGGEEATKWCDERCECCEDKDVELHWCYPERMIDVGPCWQVVRLSREDWIRRTLQACPEVRPKVVHWADEVAVSYEHVRHEEPEDHGTNPGAYEAFNGLFGAELDELCPAECDATNVGEDVVGNYQRDG